MSCPDCGNPLISQGGCLMCYVCGYSPCAVSSLPWTRMVFLMTLLLV
ncbi:MAG: hypothetical protein HYU64_14995 [Armatimonadetes bacterium]|nr:hypothetical protein [Armatimonadota bacterium]